MNPAANTAPNNPANVAISGGNVYGPVIAANYGPVHTSYAFTINVAGTQVADGGKLMVTTRETVTIIPRAPRTFYDREGPMRDLQTQIQPGQGAWITGARGCGVTMLLRKFTHDPAAQQLPHGMIYLDDVLAPDGLAETLQVLYNYYHEGNAPIAVTMQEAHAFLSTRRAVLILDHLPLSYDDLTSLADMAQASAILIASEHSGPDFLAAVQLKGLPRQDAVAVCAGIAQADMSDQGIAAAIAQICIALHDLPLPLVLIGRLLREPHMMAGKVAESLQKLTTMARAVAQQPGQIASNDEPLALAATFILQRLSHDEQTILATLTHVGQIERDALMAISQLASPVIDAAMQHLERLGLIVGGNSRYRVSFASLRRVFSNLLPRIEEQRRAALFFQEAALTHAHDLNWLAHERRHILAAIENLLTNGRATEAGNLTRVLQPALVLGGQWHAWSRVVQLAEQAASSNGDQALMAWVLHERGTLAGLNGNPVAAKADLDTAHKRRLELGDAQGAAVSQHNLRYFGLYTPSPPTFPRKLLAGIGVGAVVLAAAWGLTWPNAQADTAIASERQALDLPVLANDSASVSGLDWRTLAIATQPAHGLATVNFQTGQIGYRPDDSFTGQDAFRYQICDHLGRCVNAAVQITTGGTPVGGAPTPLIPSPTASTTPAPIATPTSTLTRTPIDTPTNTPTATSTSTDTPTNTPTDTPTITPTNTPTDTPTITPIVDKTPPTISTAGFSPTPVSLDDPGPLLITIAAADPSGIRSVQMRYRYFNKQTTGPWHTMLLAPIGNRRYGTQIDLITQVDKDGLDRAVSGQIEYYIIATDNRDNTNPAELKYEPYKGWTVID